MGRTYTVPRNVKGETRILVIFTVKSLLTTIVFGVVGFIIAMLLSAIGLAMVGWILCGILALIGYCMGALVIPDSPMLGNLRKAGGESLGEITLRTLRFKGKKKIYVYRHGGIK